MFNSYDYKKKREVIELVGEFYDTKRKELLEEEKKFDDTIAELERLTSITTNTQVINCLSKYKTNVEYIKMSRKKVDVIRLSKPDLIKKVLDGFFVKGWYEKDMIRLKRNLWVYGNY